MNLTGKIKKAIKYATPYGMVKQPKANPDLGFSWESVPYPTVYNTDGEKMSWYYLSDTSCVHTPYSLVAGRMPKHIIWDRFNRGLEKHFYVHDNMKETSELCRQKYGLLRESESIIPKTYEWVLKEESIIKEFDGIYTFSERVLDKYPNAHFAIANGSWYGRGKSYAEIEMELSNGKTKNISMVASNKCMCEMHKLRLDIAHKAKESGLVDVYGKSVGMYLPEKDEALTAYRYSIAIENDIQPYYFTEKILDCFASKTVPIYIGATELYRWFNMDGVISISPSDVDRLPEILKNLGKEDYRERMTAIEENFIKVREFECIEDYLSKVYGF